MKTIIERATNEKHDVTSFKPSEAPSARTYTIDEIEKSTYEGRCRRLWGDFFSPRQAKASIALGTSLVPNRMHPRSHRLIVIDAPSD